MRIDVHAFLIKQAEDGRLIFRQKKALIFRSGLNKYGTYLLSRDESQYHRP